MRNKADFYRKLKRLEKSPTTLLSLGLLCACLSVLVLVQSLRFKSYPESAYQVNNFVIPEISLRKNIESPDYRPAIMQIVQKSRSMSFFKARELTDALIKVCLKHKVDPFFVAALIQEESRFRVSVTSNKGAIGLMQIKPSTARYIAKKYDLSFHDSYLTDSELNIFLGISYLKYLAKKFDGRVDLTLAAYNWGPGNVYAIRGDLNRLPSVTQKYVRSINSNFSRWKMQFA
jgi:hypothetical protein